MALSDRLVSFGTGLFDYVTGIPTLLDLRSDRRNLSFEYPNPNSHFRLGGHYASSEFHQSGIFTNSVIVPSIQSSLSLGMYVGLSVCDDFSFGMQALVGSGTLAAKALLYRIGRSVHVDAVKAYDQALMCKRLDSKLVPDFWSEMDRPAKLIERVTDRGGDGYAPIVVDGSSSHFDRGSGSDNPLWDDDFDDEDDDADPLSGGMIGP